MKYYRISEDDLKNLLRRASIFTVIEQNNIIYSDIVKDALDDIGYSSVEEVIEKEILPYCEEI